MAVSVDCAMSSRDPEAGPSPRYSQDVEMEREDAGADSSAEFETSIETDGAGAGKRKRIRVPISAEQSTALHGLLIRVRLRSWGRVAIE